MAQRPLCSEAANSFSIHSMAWFGHWFAWLLAPMDTSWDGLVPPSATLGTLGQLAKLPKPHPAGLAALALDGHIGQWWAMLHHLGRLGTPIGGRLLGHLLGLGALGIIVLGLGLHGLAGLHGFHSRLGLHGLHGLHHLHG